MLREFFLVRLIIVIISGLSLHAFTMISTNFLNILDKVRYFSHYSGFKCHTPFFHVMLPLEENGLVEKKKISKVDRLKFIRMRLSYLSHVQTWLGLLPFFAYSYWFIGIQSFQKVSLERLHIRPH